MRLRPALLAFTLLVAVVLTASLVTRLLVSAPAAPSPSGAAASNAANICSCVAVFETWSSPRTTWLTPMSMSSIAEGSM